MNANIPVLVRVHRHTAQYLNNVSFPFEGFAEEGNLEKIVLYVVNKAYGFSKSNEAHKFAYDLATELGGYR